MEDSATSSVPSTWASLTSWFTSTVFFILLNLMIATILFTSNLPNNNHHQQQEHEHDHDHDNEQKQNSHDHRNQPKIDTSLSILHRLKSFNFYAHRSLPDFSPETHHYQQPLELTATEFVFNQLLNHQHFDFNTSPGQIPADDDPLPDTETRVVWEQQEAVETVMPMKKIHFDFDPTHQEIRKDTGFEDSDEEDTDEFQSLDEVYSRLKLKGGHVDRTKSDGELPPKPPAKMKKSASLKVGFSHSDDEQIVEARRPATVRERKSAAREMEHDDVEVDAKADDFINKFKNDLKLQRIESIIRTKGTTSRGTFK